MGRKRPVPWLSAPARRHGVGRSSGAARPQLLANGGDRQLQHGSVRLAGNAQAKESVKGTAENLCTGSTEAVPLPPPNPCLGSCSQGCKKQKV